MRKALDNWLKPARVSRTNEPHVRWRNVILQTDMIGVTEGLDRIGVGTAIRSAGSALEKPDYFTLLEEMKDTDYSLIRCFTSVRC